MIKVDSLSRRYGSKAAVDKVTFSIADSEIVGLLGHNGAGKTTMMRMLSGYLEPSAGSVLIHGENLADNPRNIQRQLGYLPENPPVYPDMSVADYMDYVATLKSLAGQEADRAIHEAIAATDLKQRALDKIATLSRGLRQRVGVAQAILGKPRLLILDEPTNGLDPQQAEDMRQLIRHLARRSTVILSTHLMQEVEALCDRVLVLREGQLVMDSSLAELHDSRILILRTSAQTKDPGNCLAELPIVVEVSRSYNEGDVLEFKLHIKAGVDMDRAAGDIAQCVVSAGASLLGLQPLRQNMEIVFRKVSSVDH